MIKEDKGSADKYFDIEDAVHKLYEICEEFPTRELRMNHFYYRSANDNKNFEKTYSSDQLVEITHFNNSQLRRLFDELQIVSECVEDLQTSINNEMNYRCFGTCEHTRKSD
jgi:hypothetical protein